MSNPEAGVFKKENPRKARSDFRVENGRNAPDRPLNTGKKRYEREGILIERAQGDETTDDSSDAILSTKVTGTEVVRHREDLKNNPLVTEEMQMLREKLLQSSTVSETVAQQKGLEDENEEFEISPFVGKDVDAFTTFINDMDADLVSDDEPCPELLIEALKKTGVTIALIDNVEHTVTISQKLKSGRVKEHVLTPHEVLEFLKDAIDFYEDTYADLEYKKSADFKNILMHEKTKPQTVSVDQSMIKSSLPMDDVSVYDFPLAHVSIEDRSKVKGLKNQERYPKGDLISWPKELLLILERFGATNIEQRKDEENNISFDLVTKTGKVIHHKKKQSELIDFLSEAEKLLGNEKSTQKNPHESAVLGAMRKANAPEKGISKSTEEINDTEKSQKIVEVSNFEELNVVLQQIGTIKNNENKITETEEYIQRITKLIEHLESATAPFPMDDAVIRSFPSTYGLRDKIIGLVKDSEKLVLQSIPVTHDVVSLDDKSIASLSQESVEIVPNFSYYRDLSPEETLVYEQLDVLGFTESVRDLVPAFEKLDVGEKKEIKNKVLSLRDTYIRTYVANTYAQVINGERKSTSALGNAIISAREFLRIPQNKKRQAQEIEKMKKELHFSNLEKLLEVLVRDVRESGLFDMYEDDEETDNKYVKLFSECVVNEESTPASIITEEANEVLNDTEKSQKIVEVSNFEELNVVLQQIGTIKNNENKITETEEYIQRITKLIEHLESATAPFPMDDAVIRSFPSTYGVRGKIIDLIRENDIKKFPGIVSEKVDVEIQDDFEDSHLDSADSQDSVVNTGAGIDSVSDEPVLKTLHSIDLNLDEAVTPVRKKETFDSRFTLEFDIGEKEMNSIEGFQDLSVPQQKMLFENLKEYAERGDKTWLDKGWSGIKASFGIKGEGIPSLGSKGMKAYGEVLKKLVYAADKFGPKVHEDETNGELRVDFIGLNPERAHRQEQKEVENALNDAAHAFAHVPESWQEDGNGVHAKNESSVTTFFKEKFMGGLSASRRRYHEFEEKQTAFDVAKREFAHKLEETGVPQAEIVRTLIDIEAKVHNLRFIDTNPEAVEALKSITETGFWEMAGRTAVGASGYFALGMGSRAIISGAFGMLSGPAVAAGIGSIRSWNKFNAEQRDRDRQARMGDADTSDGALNIVSASKDIQITDKDGGVEKREVGITAKLENLVTKFKNLSDTVTLEERNKLLDTLNARTLYSLDKFKLNRIQFGSKEEFATKQAKFFEVLSMAQIILAELKMDIEGDDSSITKRIVKYMNYRESSISSKRTHARAKNVAWAATKAAAFSLAGAFAMEEIKTGNVSETVRHWFNRGAEIETFNTVSIANVGSMSSGMIEEPISIIPQTPNVDSIKPNESLLPNEKIISKFLPYQIKSGDTLTKIVKENIPAIKGITNAMEKERVLANLFRSLTPQELSAIGIRSGDVNVIYTGDSIKLDALAEIVASKKSL